MGWAAQATGNPMSPSPEPGQPRYSTSILRGPSKTEPLYPGKRKQNPNPSVLTHIQCTPSRPTKMPCYRGKRMLILHLQVEKPSFRWSLSLGSPCTPRDPVPTEHGLLGSSAYAPHLPVSMFGCICSMAVPHIFLASLSQPLLKYAYLIYANSRLFIRFFKISIIVL